VPVCGAAILDDTLTQAVLVQSWNGSSWGFPKGKINEGESTLDCAVREVQEEVGLNISAYVDSNRVIVSKTRSGQTLHLYVAIGVSKLSRLRTSTRKEISSIRWFLIDDPELRSDPIVAKVRSWITRYRATISHSAPTMQCFSLDERAIMKSLDKVLARA
jgi:mRNA-decapping enzyme subunit 2